MQKYLYLLICVFVFTAGAYIWRIKNAGLSDLVLEAEDAKISGETPALANTVIAEIGEDKIRLDDIEWEYNLLVSQVNDKETLTAIPELGARFDKEMAPLKKELVGAIVERKMLFRFIQLDHDFSFDDAARYTNCISEWQQVVKDNIPAVQDRAGRERLKSRLCERSILSQYLKERLFASVQVGEAEIVEYYKNHATEFREPEKVKIRHILLGDEAGAKKLRAQVNADNFASMATSKSIAPESAKGGLLPAFAKGTMPSVFDQAFQMKRGDISDVLKSNYGYHLIMVLEKLPKHELSLDDARTRIVKAIRKKKEDEAYRQWVERALATVNVSTSKPAAW